MTVREVLRRPIVWLSSVAASGIVAYLLFPMLSDTPQALPSETILVAEGAPIYAEYCASCHGANLEGQPNWRSRLPTGGLPAPPHDETGHTWHHPDQQLFEITKYGGQRLAPAGFQSNMPAFEDRLNDRQIAAVLAFIRSRWPQSIQDRQRRLSERAE